MRIKFRKGLEDIRTRSGLTGDAENPQRKYLRVACLELRKSLCKKVRDAARSRAAEMDRKIAELDGEEARTLAVPEIGEQAHAIPALHMARGQRSAAQPGFTLKY